MEVVLFYIFIAICILYAYVHRRRVELGVLTSKSGTMYTYAIGNYLTSETSSFNGVDVTLPHSFTNFYLDSHKDAKLKGPAALYDPSQKISLEGNFNTSFQLFVPKGTATMALSVLSPDVMQTLLNYSERYDVELAGNHLRLITPDKVSKMTGGHIIVATQAIVDELDQRSKSWQHTAESPKALVMKRGATYSLASIYLRRSRLLASIGSVLGVVVLSGLGLAFYYTKQDPHFSNPYSKGVFAGSLMYAAVILLIIAIPVVMMTPIVWFLKNRQSNDVFPKF